MDIYITDENLNEIEVIDHASVIWNTKYNDAGEFEIYVPASKEMLDLAREGVFACRDNSDTIMIIEKIQTKTDMEAGDFITVSGRSAETLLNRRIVWNQTNINGDAAQEALRIVQENLIIPAAVERKIPIIQQGNCESAEITTQRQLWGEDLFECFKELLALADMGFRIRRKDGILLLDIYKGQNRSGDIIFSTEYDNLTRSEHVYDRSEHKNAVLVSGEGEGNAKKICTVGTTAGLARRETYLEKGNKSSNEGEVTEEDYMNLLKGEGDTALAEKKISQTVNAEIEPGSMFRMGEDYFLGDIVSIKDDYGNINKVRISQIAENSDENGDNLVLSCENIKEEEIC